MRNTKLAHKLSWSELNDEIPFQTLMYMNAIIPDYGKNENEGGTTTTKKKKAMSLWDIAAAVGKGESI